MDRRNVPHRLLLRRGSLAYPPLSGGMGVVTPLLPSLPAVPEPAETPDMFMTHALCIFFDYLDSVTPQTSNFDRTSNGYWQLVASTFEPCEVFRCLWAVGSV